MPVPGALNPHGLAGCRLPAAVRYTHLQRVSKVSAGGSAYRSGIAVGDVIVDIDGRSVLHAPHDVVIGMLRAAKRRVTITMLPPQVGVGINRLACQLAGDSPFAPDSKSPPPYRLPTEW